MLNRGIILGWEGSPSRKSRLGRETSLEWESRLCREDWLGITYSDGCIHQFNPTSFSHPPLSTFMMLPDPTWCFWRLAD